MSIWTPGTTLEGIVAYQRGTMVEHLGIVLTELGPDFIRGTMRATERTIQPMGILHGGASVVLAETLGSCASNSTIDRQTRACVGQEINANHLRPVPLGGLVTGTARPIHLGATSKVWGIELRNEAGKLTCISRLTMAIIARRPAAP